MKSIYLIALVTLLTQQLSAQDWNWVKSGGDASSERTQATVVDANGFIYSTGYFQGNFTIGGQTLVNAGTGNDAFITKHDRFGNLVWAVNAGGSGSNSTVAYGIDIDPSGNIYITGSFSGSATFDLSTVTSSGGDDLFIAKYDNNGNGVWVRRGGGSSTIIGRDIAVDAQGNPHVSGNFYNTATIGSTSISSAGQEDIFVCKYTTTGVFQWARDGNGSGRDYATSVVVDSAGNVTIGGYGGGGTNITFDSQSIGVGGAWDIVLAQYNSSGTIQWVHKAGGSANDVLYGMDLDPAGNIYCTGIVRNTANFDGMSVTAVDYYDVFLAKYSQDGTIQFVKNTGGLGDDRGQAIAVNDLGESYVAGYFLSDISIAGQTHVSNGSSDICVIKYDSLGNELWGLSAGGSSGHDYGKGIGVYDVGGAQQVYVGGFYQGTVAFGDSTLSSASASRDAFIGKICAVPGPIITGDDALCTGSSLVLTAGGGGSYAWNTGSTTDTISVSPPTPTTYYVTITDSLGCSGADSHHVAIHTSPSVSIANQSDVDCHGDCNGTATAAAGGSGTFSFLWDASAGSQTGAQATNLCAGTYSVILTDSNNCQDSSTVAISEPPAITANISFQPAGPDCDGSATVTGGGGSPGYTYAWNTGDTTVTIDSLCTGTYCVTITDSMGCTLDTCTTVLTALDEGSGPPDFQIYPNPSSGSVTVDNPIYQEAEMEVFNSMGQLLFRQRLENGKNHLSIPGKGAQVYFIKLVVTGKPLQTKRILVIQ